MYMGMTHHSVYRKITGKWMITLKHGLTNKYLDIPGYFQVIIPQKNKHFTQYDIHLMEYIGYNVICIYIYIV